MTKYLQDDKGNFSLMRLLTAAMVMYCLFHSSLIFTVWTIVSLQSGKIQPMPENLIMFLIGGATGSMGLKAWQKFAEIKSENNYNGFGNNFFDNYPDEPQRVDNPDSGE